MKTEMKKTIVRQSLKLTSFMFFILLTFFSAVLFVITPFVLNNIISENHNLGIVAIFVVVSVLIIGHTIEVVAMLLGNKLSQKYNVDMTLALYKRVFKLSYDSYLTMEPSFIQQRIESAVGAFAKFYFSTVPALLINAVMAIITLTITFTINPIIALLMFSTLPLNYFGYKILNKKLSQLSLELNNVCSRAWKDENAIISQVDFIKQNAENAYLLPLIKRHKNDAQDITRRVNNVANGFSCVLSGVNIIIKSLLILFLASMILEDANATGNLLFVILVLPYFTSAIASLTNTNLNFSEIKAAEEFFDKIENSQEQNGFKQISKIDTIRFDIDKVTIGSKTLVNNVTCDFKRGNIVGIMGESGKGKSTLAKLIVKFRDARGIYVDDIPLSDIRNEDYLKRVSYYSQNAPIISDSIINNINFGRMSVTEKDCKSLSFLNKFTDLDEVILENGANLSGGDKQRIALARFFTEEADIVVLDEPTSSLDEATEAEILTDILKQNTDRIIFLVSHKAENMRFCTHVMKITNGKVVVSTPHSY